MKRHIPEDVVPGINSQTYEAIRVWVKAHGYSPTVREIAAVLGISQTAAYARLLKLEDAGLVEWPERFGTGSRRTSHTLRLLPQKEVQDDERMDRNRRAGLAV